MGTKLQALVEECNFFRNQSKDLDSELSHITDTAEFHRRKYVEEIARIYKFDKIFSFLEGDLLYNILHVGDLTKVYELKEHKTTESLAILRISFAIDIGSIYIYVDDEENNEIELHTQLDDFGANFDAIKDAAEGMQEMIEDFKESLLTKLTSEL